ncbi:hypothetical protein GQ44DRAFT_760716 [Phaeosphaeriaceae sp. PMI808]|nr:hypothetical protein GQ44DRAFT_760716 [Phaeosphaeriaceae sp. PMI808]
MQRDIDLTIADIHVDIRNDPSTLGEFSNHVVSQETHTNLRFLKIPYLKQYSDLYPEVTCELTEKGDHPGEKSYVAVSYCWESFNKPDPDVDEGSLRSPKILVRQRGKPPRAPQCPAKVLMRAIAFAIWKGTSLIWIDQECVNQNDPVDTQNHLDCNNIIYNQAEFKIGLVGFQLSASQADKLLNLELYHMQGDPKPVSRLLAEYGVKSILRDIRHSTRLLRAIHKDRWFTRAWVYQERHSANMDMHLLIPLSAEGLKTFRGAFGIELVGEDYPLYVGAICSIAAKLRSYFSQPELGQLLQEDISVKDSIYESLNSLHEAAQLLSGPIFSGTSFDRVFKTLESKILDADKINNIRSPHLHQIFMEIESCDCQKVSDRVAILSNIMNFQQTVIPASFKSYSWALLMLLSANSHVPSVLVREETLTQPNDLLSFSVPASGLIMLAYEMKESIAAGRLELQKGLESVTCALADLFKRDITRHTEFWDAVEDAAEGLPAVSRMGMLSLLSEIKAQKLKRVVVFPLSVAIGDIIGGIVSPGHVDNIGLQFSHGQTVVKYGIDTNQLKESVTFMAFAGEYRWRSRFIERFAIEE